MNRFYTLSFYLVVSALTATAEPVKVLLIDGQNNHDWKRTTASVVGTLEVSGRFIVDVSTTPENHTPLANRVANKASDAEKTLFQDIDKA
jgi:hypothetical protein